MDSRQKVKWTACHLVVVSLYLSVVSSGTQQPSRGTAHERSWAPENATYIHTIYIHITCIMYIISTYKLSHASLAKNIGTFDKQKVVRCADYDRDNRVFLPFANCRALSNGHR